MEFQVTVQEISLLSSGDWSVLVKGIDCDCRITIKPNHQIRIGQMFTLEVGRTNTIVNTNK